MGHCDVCGNDYEKAFEVVIGSTAYHYDSFDCAVQALATVCSACGCKVIGGGVMLEGAFYCSAACAEEAFTEEPDARRVVVHR